MAVLGDSDSQGFQDAPDFHPEATPRGGRFHATTLQWTEALSAMRGDQIDLGAWGVHGMSGRLAIALERLGLASAAESLGWEVRAPIKRDHRFNFAYAGDGCADLFGGWSRQAPRLVRTMDADPDLWRAGIVVIRIGGNDFANDSAHLGMLAQDPRAPEVLRRMDACLVEIRKGVDLIHRRHPEVRVVLVGAFDNAHWERYQGRWQSPQMLGNIGLGLDHFDGALKAMAAADPRLAFFSDRQWFDGLWGSRDADGRPHYRAVELAPGIRVTNTGGDAPTNATLSDGHAGLAWNALWAQALVKLISERFNVAVTPISQDEVLRFVRGTGAFEHLDRTSSAP